MAQPQFERSFLRLASTWLACRCAVMGGQPQIAGHAPVVNFETLAWPMLGCSDYGAEMALECAEEKERLCKPLRM